MLADLHAKGVAVKAMVAMFPGRTLSAVFRRRATLNLTKHNQHVPYSQSEDEKLLRLRSEGKSYTTISSAFPQRTRTGLARRSCRIRIKAVSLGTPKPPRCSWTDEEKQRLKDLASQGLSWRETAQLMPSRSLSSAEGAASRMWLLTTRPSNRWTTEEDEALAKGREAGMTYKSIHATMLPGRTPGALKRRYSVYHKR